MRKTSIVSGACGMYSWMPKLGTAVSRCTAAASVTGDRSVAPCEPVRTWYSAARSKIRRRWVMPPAWTTVVRT